MGSVQVTVKPTSPPPCRPKRRRFKRSQNHVSLINSAASRLLSLRKVSLLWTRIKMVSSPRLTSPLPVLKWDVQELMKIGHKWPQMLVPISFTVLLNMFASKSSGEQDDDDAVVAAFQSFEGATPGTIDPDQFKTMLQAFGQKFTDQEVEDVFGMVEMTEDGQINSDKLIGMLVAKGD